MNGHSTSSRNLDPIPPSPNEIADRLGDLLAEQSGFPRVIITPEAHLEHDLKLRRYEVEQIWQDLHSQLIGTLPSEECPNSVETVQQLVEFMAAHQPSAVGVSEQYRTADNLMRGLFRIVEIQRESQTASPWPESGSALILGDNPAATALREQLQGYNIPVHQYAVQRETASLLSELGALFSRETVPHLFLMMGRDPVAEDNDSSPLHRMSLPFRICQQWLAHMNNAKGLKRATLAAVTSLGGDFGFSGRIANGKGAGVAGLLKAIAAETQGKLNVRVLDAPANEPAKMIAVTLCRELDYRNVDVEAAVVRGKLFGLRMVPDPLPADLAAAPNQGAVWLVTGDVSRSTAHRLRELGRRFGIQFRILEPASATVVDDVLRNLASRNLQELRWQVMREAAAAGETPFLAWERVRTALERDALLQYLRQEGVSVDAHRCDLQNPHELQSLLDSIRKTTGPIEGILHTTSHERPTRLQKKTPEGLDQVLRENVLVPQALLEATRQDRLMHCLVLTKGWGRFGAALQSAGGMAEELLSKLVSGCTRLHPDCHAIALHPQAAQTAEAGEKNPAPTTLTSPEPTAEEERNAFRFVDAALRKSPELEVVLLEETELADTSDRVEGGKVPHPSRAIQRAVAESPLIERIYPGELCDCIAEMTFDPVRDPFLSDHLGKGVPLLPAVVGLETCAEAAWIWGKGTNVTTMRNLEIHNGFFMAGTHPHQARVHLTLHGHLAECALSGEFYDKQGRLTDPHRLYQGCQFELAETVSAPSVPDLGERPVQWKPVVYRNHSSHSAAFEGTICYGPELQTLKSVHHLPDGSWGQLVAPETASIGGTRPGKRWQIPIAILDGAMFLCDLYSAHAFGTRQLPQVIDRIDFFRMPAPGEHCLTRCLFLNRTSQRISLDFWILGATGDVILTCKGYHVVIMPEPSEKPTNPRSPN